MCSQKRPITKSYPYHIHSFKFNNENFTSKMQCFTSSKAYFIDGFQDLPYSTTR